MRPPTTLLIAARQMLDLSQAELADELVVGSRTVYELERANGSTDIVEALITYFEGRGITFKALGGREGWAICNSNVLGTYDEERSRAWPGRGKRKKKETKTGMAPQKSESKV